MQLRISYRTGIVLGCLGWLLTALPSAIAICMIIASGHSVNATLDGALLIPFAGLLFVASLYLEAGGRLGSLPPVSCLESPPPC